MGDQRNTALAAVQIGAVSYLNSRPLIYQLHGSAPDIELTEDLPSRLAQGLRDGRFDIALIPSIEYFRLQGARVVGDPCIACRGAVRSVKLYSRVPFDAIGSLALDEGSRTSAALVRILLSERFACRPALEQLPIGSMPDESRADAVLLIGDRAMRLVPDGRPYVWDLGAEWTRWTGLPFVFAMWVARPGAVLGLAPERLSTARDEGVRHLVEIARQEAPRVGIPESECIAYLCEHLHFCLGSQERQGLERFYQLAVRHGLAPAGAELAS